MSFQKLIIKFPWTTIGTLLINVVTFTTAIVVAVQNGYGIDKVISGLPKALLMMNFVALLIFPFIDLYEQFLDRRMCKALGANYQKDFVLAFNEDEKETIRENFKNTNIQGSFTLNELAKKN